MKYKNPSYHFLKLRYFPLFLIMMTGFFSCSLKREVKLGREAYQSKNWDQAADHFLKAVREKPDNVEYRISLGNALISASNDHLEKGQRFLDLKQFRAALMEFEKSLEFNPDNNRARQQKFQLLKQMKKWDESEREKFNSDQINEQEAMEKKILSKSIDYKKKPYNLKFQSGDLKQIFKALQKSSGITFLYDEAFKSRRMEVEMENVDFMEALDRLMIQATLFYKVIDEKTVLIIPDIQNKRKEHEELMVKSYFLMHTDPEDIQKIISQLLGAKQAIVNKETRSIIMRGTPGEIKLAERIIRAHDKPRGEILMDIEIIEVNRSRVKEYGIELSDYQVSQYYLPENVTDLSNATSTIRLNMIPHTDMSDYLLTLPSMNYKLLKNDSDSRIKARPQLRIIDRREAEVLLGDKIPVPGTTFVPYNTGGLNQQPITSYDMKEIGIKIKVTPLIHLDGLITLEMKFELTYITNPGTTTMPPTLGNRSVSTVIELRDNETSMLAGLLRDTERKSIRGFPIVSSIPILRDIFSGNDNEIEQTDIIMTLTPRIVRFPDFTPEDSSPIWSGTMNKPGLSEKPAKLKPETDPNGAENNQKSTPSTPSKKEEEKIKPSSSTIGETNTNSEVKQEVKPETMSESVPVKIESSTFTSTENKIEPTGSVPPPVSAAVTDTTPVATPVMNIVLGSPGLELKKNNEMDIPITIKGTGTVRAVSFDLNFDPSILRLLDIRKSEILEQKKVKCQLLKSIDNAVGKLKATLSMEEPFELTDETILLVLRLTPGGTKTGETVLSPSNIKLMDPDLKEIESKHAGLLLSISD